MEIPKHAERQRAVGEGWNKRWYENDTDGEVNDCLIYEVLVRDTLTQWFMGADDDESHEIADYPEDSDSYVGTIEGVC